MYTYFFNFTENATSKNFCKGKNYILYVFLDNVVLFWHAVRDWIVKYNNSLGNYIQSVFIIWFHKQFPEYFNIQISLKIYGKYISNKIFLKHKVSVEMKMRIFSV